MKRIHYVVVGSNFRFGTAPDMITALKYCGFHFRKGDKTEYNIFQFLMTEDGEIRISDLNGGVSWNTENVTLIRYLQGATTKQIMEHHGEEPLLPLYDHREEEV